MVSINSISFLCAASHGQVKGTNSQTDRQKNRNTGKWHTDDGRTEGQSDGRTDGRTDGQTDDGRTDGRTDGGTDGQTDGRTDGR